MSQSQLSRHLTLLQATAINMTDMVGIGPFVVLSVVAEIMHGPWFLYAWIAGALLSFIDAMVWSELGTTFPEAGGSYNFLKESFGPKTGKLMSFLFVWQTMIQAPLVIASAAIGFAQYTMYLYPLGFWETKAVSGMVIILIVFLLYRNIETIGKISVALWVGVVVTMIWIISGGVAQGHFLEPIKHINDGFELNMAFAAALGAASVKSVYSYLGYYNVCHLGGEIIAPQKNIPRSMFISIAGIAVLYLCMNISVASVLPLAQIEQSQFVISEFIQQIAGPKTAMIATILILWIAFASVFSATLGYSRIPYAAAKDGAFFKVFAKLHPTKNFPYVSLLVLGAVAFGFSMLFKLKEVISAILAMRIMIQFIGQAIGLLALSKRKGRDFMKWKMPLYPIPVILAILIWIGIFISTGRSMMLAGLGVTLLGMIIYYLKTYTKVLPYTYSILTRFIR
ncbi:APC family permease [Chitinophaga sancti]|uniref:APC family permease n=1 Tax=Chitinophaga sancti TaxID=1004 RepID=A0A1K1QXS2_9BACT|nr:APC family permease [Chitinophaga sancti]WQD62050.1 APC family permease [Chitinophaga sancti]WQG92381.1 APC family permease [Chitinophaga sancti]SFW64581.1 amino acid/polyamine/organocation transporter, APC superfamily [Chitinophaga sancti]